MKRLFFIILFVIVSYIFSFNAFAYVLYYDYEHFNSYIYGSDEYKYSVSDHKALLIHEVLLVFFLDNPYYIKDKFSFAVFNYEGKVKIAVLCDITQEWKYIYIDDIENNSKNDIVDFITIFSYIVDAIKFNCTNYIYNW